MLAAKRQEDLLQRATEIAEGLARGGVTRAEIRPVLNALFLPSGSWAERLKQAKELMERLPESWVGKRSNTARERYARVRSAFRPLLEAPLPPAELRFLLGWITRLVHVADLEAKQRAKEQRS
jgi:hypothetical protein